MMPPYKLPDHKTVSTLKSRSSMQGGASNFNELRYEDLKGSEQVFLHAERDKDERVKAESREFVGGNRHLMVTASRKASIGGSDNLAVGGDFSESIGKNFNTTVQADSRELVNGNKSITVQGNTEEITGGKFGHSVAQEIHLMAGTNVVIEAGMALTIKAGGNFITLGPTGIAISGTMVLINSGGAPVPGSEVTTDAPTDPAAPDTADDGTKFDKL
jgi:type VI secretion system secreted protein VgrG